MGQVLEMVACWDSLQCDTPPNGGARTRSAYFHDCVAEGLRIYGAPLGGITSFQRPVIMASITTTHVWCNSEVRKQTCALSRGLLAVSGPKHALVKSVYGPSTIHEERQRRFNPDFAGSWVLYHEAAAKQCLNHACESDESEYKPIFSTSVRPFRLRPQTRIRTPSCA